MEPIYIAAALLSAALHAGWNAAVKASARPTEVMATQMLMSGLIVLPGLLWTGLPHWECWPWIAASTAVNTLAVATLLRAYELGGFGIVYPVARSVSVMLVVPMSTAVAGDSLTTGALAGIGLVVAALGLLGTGARGDQTFTLGALAWTLAAGVATSVYIMCDARGVRLAGSPWAYCFVVSICNAAVMCWRQRRVMTPRQLLVTHGALAAPAAVAAVISYALILWVWSRAPIAPASALRDTSAVFAILISVVWLKEPFTARRLAAVLLVAAAVPLLRLA